VSYYYAGFLIASALGYPRHDLGSSKGAFREEVIPVGGALGDFVDAKSLSLTVLPPALINIFRLRAQ
jgi:hypothetical protein